MQYFFPACLIVCVLLTHGLVNEAVEFPAAQVHHVDIDVVHPHGDRSLRGRFEVIGGDSKVIFAGVGELEVSVSVI